MAPRKLPDGRWLVDIRPAGSRSARIRKKFDTKPEAIRFEAWCRAEAAQKRAWNPAGTDRRTLSELISRWYDLHGHNLKDAQKRLARLEAIDKGMGNPLAVDVTAKSYADFRAARMRADGVVANTVNHELAFLKAVFNELERLGEWSGGNPLASVRHLTFDEQEMAWLDIEQIRLLLDECRASANASVYWVARICLGTGARWGEGEALSSHQIRAGRIHYSNTKSRKNRAVPYLDPELDAWIHGKSGALFESCRDAFRSAIARTGIQLPAGQLTHVCRHTFAAHFMLNGGNLLTLQKILGHASITMTMKYAHFAPDFLSDAPKYSPLAKLL